MVLDEPSQEDQVEVIDGITVATDQWLVGMIDFGVIDVQKVFWIEQLILRSPMTSSC